MSKKDWQLLKAYQATGLTPHQVAETQKELFRRTNQVYAQAEEMEKNHQLEESYEAMCRDLQAAVAKADSLRSELAAVKQERDAAVADMRNCKGDICNICQHYIAPGASDCDGECENCCNRCKCYTCDENQSEFCWRGVEEESDE